MADVLGPTLMFFFCLLISYLEYTRYKTILTPFGVMAWPYTIIVLMINFGGKHFGFFPVSLQSILFILACWIFFLAGGYAGLALIRNGEVEVDSIMFKTKDSRITEYLDYYRTLFIALGVISFIAGAIHFYQVLRTFGWVKIPSRDFRTAYSSSGILSHIMLLGTPAFIFLFLDYLTRKRKINLVLLTLLFFMTLARQVKYHVFVILLSSLYLGYLHNLLKFNFKKILLYSFIVYLLFNMSYTIGFGALGINRTYSPRVQAFLFNHFFAYLFGGPIGFSEILKDPAYPMYSFKEIISVPLNIARFLRGDSGFVNIVFKNWVPISTIHNYFHGSNVFGMFGMIYAYIGTYITLILGFIMGMFTYVFGFLILKNRDSLGFQLTYVFILSFLTLSFFAFYFNVLSFVEVSFYMLTIPFLHTTGRKLMHFTKLQHQRS